MSRARDFADLAGAADAGGLTGRNLIINGAMQVAQRGTSGTSTADIYTVDRFAVGHGSPVNAMTFEQSTDTPDNFKNSLKVTAGTGASAGTTGYATLRQAIEGQNMAHLGFGTSAAKAITLSFYVKCSLTGTFGISIRNQAGDRAYAGTYVINSANTWEYKTVAIPGDASGTWPTDTGLGFNLFWDLGAGSNYDIAAGSWTTGSNMFGVESTVKLTETTGATFFITGVQLEVGEQATPFEHRSYGDELARCKRYFHRWVATDNYGNIANGGVLNTSQARAVTFLPVEQRTSGSFSSNGSFRFVEYGHNSSSATLSLIRGHPLTPYIQASGSAVFQVGQFGEMGADNDVDAFIDFDAEL